MCVQASSYTVQVFLALLLCCVFGESAMCVSVSVRVCPDVLDVSICIYMCV